jgi:YihY family inner membrane protein
VRSSRLIRLALALGDSSATNYASALAFAAFLAVFPLLLGCFALLGFLFQSSPVTQSALLNLLLQAFPTSAHTQIAEALGGFRTLAGLFSLLALAGLFYSASSIFSTMEFSFAQIFSIPQRSLLRQKLMCLALMGLLLVFILVVLVGNLLLAFLPFATFSTLIFTLLALFSLLLSLYRLVPNRTFPTWAAWPGALSAALLILLASLVFPLYAHFAVRANILGASFGLFFVLAAWLYLLSLFLLFGAALNRYLLGAPSTYGLLASIPSEQRRLPTPAQAIHAQLSEAAANDSPEPS